MNELISGHVRRPVDHQRGVLQEVHRQVDRVLRHRRAHLHPRDHGLPLLVREDGDEPEVVLSGLQSAVELSRTVLDDLQSVRVCLITSSKEICLVMKRKRIHKYLLC